MMRLFLGGGSFRDPKHQVRSLAALRAPLSGIRPSPLSASTCRNTRDSCCLLRCVENVCTAGSFSEQGATACSKCPAGSYLPRRPGLVPPSAFWPLTHVTVRSFRRLVALIVSRTLTGTFVTWTSSFSTFGALFRARRVKQLSDLAQHRRGFITTRTTRLWMMLRHGGEWRYWCLMCGSSVLHKCDLHNIQRVTSTRYDYNRGTAPAGNISALGDYYGRVAAWYITLR
jgi:hypothetical protein